MNPLCCIAPVSLDRGDRNNPPPLVFDSSARNNGFRQVVSAADVGSVVNREAEESALAALTEGRDSKGCCGNNGVVAGILYKWVNYGKGWRSRWFVLQDGVLSYYKIHGPDKISVGLGSEKGVRVIGEDSLRYMRKHAMRGSTKRWKPFGEIHLTV